MWWEGSKGELSKQVDGGGREGHKGHMQRGIYASLRQSRSKSNGLEPNIRPQVLQLISSDIRCGLEQLMASEVIFTIY